MSYLLKESISCKSIVKCVTTVLFVFFFFFSALSLRVFIFITESLKSSFKMFFEMVKMVHNTGQMQI